MGPRILSIMAKCSRLSCVWNSVMPRCSSNMMQPMDHTSHGCDQPSSADTYHARLILVTNMLHFTYSTLS